MKRILLTITFFTCLFSMGYTGSAQAMSLFKYAPGFQKRLIDPVLKSLDLYSESASNLLLGTAMQESHLGKITGGSPRYVYQIILPTARDILSRYLPKHPSLRSKLLSFYDAEHNLHWNITENVRFQIGLARIIYHQAHVSLPHARDINGLATFWKKYYNTRLGKGKARYFAQIYTQYLKSHSVDSSDTDNPEDADTADNTDDMDNNSVDNKGNNDDEVEDALHSYFFV